MRRRTRRALRPKWLLRKRELKITGIMSDFFINSDIYLRALEPEDLEVLYKWENDTTLWKNGASITPFSRFAIRQYIADAQYDFFQVRQLRMMIVEKTSHLPAGTVDLYDYDPLNRRAGIGILIDLCFREKGYALQALECMDAYAFEHLKLHQLYAFIPEANLPSRALFEKAGYEKTAVLKNWLAINKSWKDVVVMQKIDG